MLKLKLDDGSLIFGLSFRNLDALREDKPIYFDAKTYVPYEKILIKYGAPGAGRGRDAQTGESCLYLILGKEEFKQLRSSKAVVIDLPEMGLKQIMIFAGETEKDMIKMIKESTNIELPDHTDYDWDGTLETRWEQNRKVYEKKRPGSAIFRDGNPPG